MKTIQALIVLGCFLLGATSAYGFTPTEPKNYAANKGFGTVVYFGNGVWNDEDAALQGLKRLETFLETQKQADGVTPLVRAIEASDDRIAYNIAFNQTYWRIHDVFEAVKMKLPTIDPTEFWKAIYSVGTLEVKQELEKVLAEKFSESISYELSRDDLSRQLASYAEDHNALKRVLLVSHSAGTAFGTVAFDFLRRAYRPAFANEQVASIAKTIYLGALTLYSSLECDGVIPLSGGIPPKNIACPTQEEYAEGKFPELGPRYHCAIQPDGEKVCSWVPTFSGTWHDFATYLLFSRSAKHIATNIEALVSSAFEYPFKARNLALTRVDLTATTPVSLLSVPEGSTIVVDGLGLAAADKVSFWLQPTSLPIPGNEACSVSGSALERFSAATIGTVDEADTLELKLPATVVLGEYRVVVKREYDVGKCYARAFGRPLNVLSAPHITSISPSSGSLAGGYSATVSGSNFSSGSSVTFGGVHAVVNSISPTQISVTVPPSQVAESVSVEVTSRASDGTELVSTEDVSFTYKIRGSEIIAIAPVLGDDITATLNSLAAELSGGFSPSGVVKVVPGETLLVVGRFVYLPFGFPGFLGSDGWQSGYPVSPVPQWFSDRGLSVFRIYVPQPRYDRVQTLGLTSEVQGTSTMDRSVVVATQTLMIDYCDKISDANLALSVDDSKWYLQIDNPSQRPAYMWSAAVGDGSGYVQADQMYVDTIPAGEQLLWRYQQGWFWDPSFIRAYIVKPEHDRLSYAIQQNIVPSMGPMSESLLWNLECLSTQKTPPQPAL